MANNIDLTICALECPLGTFQCSGRLIFRLRTESAFQAAPVFRMAYSAPTAHCAVSSETLMLQVRFAHPPNPAPYSRLLVLFSKTHDLQVRFAHPPNPAPSYRFFVLFRSAYFPSPHRSPVSSPLAAAAALWLPCVRGAVRRSGLRGCPLGVGGKGEGSQALPQSPLARRPHSKTTQSKTG